MNNLSNFNPRESIDIVHNELAQLMAFFYNSYNRNTEGIPQDVVSSANLLERQIQITALAINVADQLYSQLQNTISNHKE